MKRLWLLVVALFLLTGCAAEQGVLSATVIYSGAHRYETTLSGDLYVLGGDVTLAAGAGVTGSVYLSGGSLAVDGPVGGSVTVLDGNLALGPQTVVAGDLSVGGGSVTRAPGVVVAGTVADEITFELPIAELQEQTPWYQGLLRYYLSALLLAGLGYLVARRYPRAVGNVEAVIVDDAIVAGALGLLIFFVAPILLVAMAFTLFLIPLALLAVAALALLLGYGYIAIGAGLGRRLVRRWLPRVSVPGATAFGTLLWMALLDLVGRVPFIGGAVVVLVSAVALGAVFVTRLGLSTYVPPFAEAAYEPADYARPELAPREPTGS